MDWLQALTIIVAVFGIFLWGRREAAADIREISSDMKNFQKEIRFDMKDFHGRLCALEEKNMNRNEKFMKDIADLLKIKK